MSVSQRLRLNFLSFRAFLVPDGRIPRYVTRCAASCIAVRYGGVGVSELSLLLISACDCDPCSDSSYGVSKHDFTSICPTTALHLAVHPGNVRWSWVGCVLYAWWFRWQAGRQVSLNVNASPPATANTFGWIACPSLMGKWLRKLMHVFTPESRHSTGVDEDTVLPPVAWKCSLTKSRDPATKHS